MIGLLSCTFELLSQTNSIFHHWVHVIPPEPADASFTLAEDQERFPALWADATPQRFMSKVLLRGISLAQDPDGVRRSKLNPFTSIAHTSQ